jgi:hypothetical protein
MLQLLNTVSIDLSQSAKNANLTGAESTSGQYLELVLGAVMIISLLLLLFNLILGSIDWITSNGDSGKLEKSRNRITQSIIGILILASMIALFLVIQSLLGFEIITLNGTPQ